MFESDFLKYLVDVAPVVAVMGFGYWILLDLFKVERKTNLELQEYIRNSDKENLELLKDFSALLNSIIEISNNNKDKIINTIVSEAKDIKHHIDSRIVNIQNKISE
jgi:hypothetical protein